MPRSLVVCATLMAVFPIISIPLRDCAASPGLLRLFSPQSRQPLANAGAAAYPLGAALFLRRAAYFQWLSLIGAVVASFAGTGGNTGLAYQILQAGYQLDISLMFAALLLISLAGIALFGVMSRLAPGAQRRMKAKPCNLINVLLTNRKE